MNLAASLHYRWRCSHSSTLSE